MDPHHCKVVQGFHYMSTKCQAIKMITSLSIVYSPDHTTRQYHNGKNVCVCAVDDQEGTIAYEEEKIKDAKSKTGAIHPFKSGLGKMKLHKSFTSTYLFIHNTNSPYTNLSFEQKKKVLFFCFQYCFRICFGMEMPGFI